MSVKRYYATIDANGSAYMREHADGEYVFFSDYEALQKNAETADLAIAALTADRDSIKAERDQLAGIVERLPKDAEGNPLRHGDVYWHNILEDGVRIPEEIRVYGRIDGVWWVIGPSSATSCPIYPSRESAEAAAKGRGIG